MFSEILKSLRSSKGLTQSQLAKEIGVSTGNIGDWEIERSKPGYVALASLAQFFGVTSDYLLGLSTENTVASDPRLQLYCDGKPLTESEFDLLAMYRLLPEDHRKEIFELVHFKYSRIIAEGEKESIYSTYSDTKRQEESGPDDDGKPCIGTA